MTEAPTNEPVDKGWTLGWTRWLKLVQLALSGWRKSVRVELTHDFGVIPSGASASTTITVQGARVGDVAKVNATHRAGIVWSVNVTANDTVTLYAQNFTVSSINPDSNTFYILVFMQ